MTQIYIVMSQENFMMRSPGIPVAAYLDYPSALTFAKSIFKPTMGFKDNNPKDLIFLLAVTPTTTPIPTTVPASA